MKVEREEQNLPILSLKECLAYRLVDDGDVFGVFDQPEDGLGSGAVRVGA